MFALLALNDEKQMEEAAKKAIKEGMSVRAIEAYVKALQTPKPQTVKKEKDVNLTSVENRLQNRFQTKVQVSEKQITIHYKGNNDLNRILELLGGIEEEV